ncbi:hypothetical protein [Intestinimonas sp.]|uniref:hypothetical protein n=1 Tax=Intestinimonas sp. TaxID=1965293 RepID=UPI00262DB1CA|nr:hypothetical protein [Intestinimonas sp.]
MKNNDHGNFFSLPNEIFLLPIQKVIDQFYERQLSALEQATTRQRAQQQAEKSGVEFIPSDKEQSA